jgi:hypothetical protein
MSTANLDASISDGREDTSTRNSTAKRDSASSFLRNMIGHRRQDYHADAPQEEQQHVYRQQLHQVASRTADNNNNNNKIPAMTTAQYPSANRITAEADAAPLPCWRRMGIAEQRRAAFTAVLNSHAWKAVLIIFAAVLLFGEELRELFLPSGADNYVDALFVLVFTFFMVDIAMRCDAENNYFNRFRCTGCCCSSGSFLFWCDLLSTLTLFYDMSWFDTPNFTETNIAIKLGDYGLPVRIQSMTAWPIRWGDCSPC